MQTVDRRRSTAIGQKAAQSLYHAFGQAERLGMPLNTHVTINFANTRCAPLQIVRAFAKLRLSSFKRWAARYSLPATGGYAFENVRDEVPISVVDEFHNIHVHWALHVPPKLTHVFSMELFGWVARATGGFIEPATAIKITNPPPLRIRGYLLKGTISQWAPIYGATAEPQGCIEGGRRTGTTKNVGPKARKQSDKTLGIRRKIPQRVNHARQVAQSCGGTQL